LELEFARSLRLANSSPENLGLPWITPHHIVVNTGDYVVLAYYRETNVESRWTLIEGVGGCGARAGENEKELWTGDAVEWQRHLPDLPAKKI
jgi:hypothetical protein